MDSEINEQPEALRSNSARYFEECAPWVTGKEFDLIVFVARGSSDNAALYGRYLVEVNLGTPVSLAAPSVWTRFQKSIHYKNTLVVGISQSGAAPDVAEVLERTRAAGQTTIAITNTEDSLLSQVAEHTLALGVGTEQSVAATKTFTASLLAIYQLTRALGAPLPVPQLPEHDWLITSREYADRNVGHIIRSKLQFALGRGYSFSIAHETALKLMECALLPCKPYSSADFDHGPRALAGPGTCAISYDGPAQNLVDQGCVVLTPPTPAVSAESAPIWNAVTAQILALKAAQALLLDPDQPQFIRKVTRTH